MLRVRSFLPPSQAVSEAGCRAAGAAGGQGRGAPAGGREGRRRGRRGRGRGRRRWRAAQGAAGWGRVGVFAEQRGRGQVNVCRRRSPRGGSTQQGTSSAPQNKHLARVLLLRRRLSRGCGCGVGHDAGSSQPLGGAPGRHGRHEQRRFCAAFRSAFAGGRRAGGGRGVRAARRCRAAPRHPSPHLLGGRRSLLPAVGRRRPACRRPRPFFCCFFIRSRSSSAHFFFARVAACLLISMLLLGSGGWVPGVVILCVSS